MPPPAPHERVVFHPTASRRHPGSDDWALAVRGRVFAPRDRSLRRRLGISLLRRALGLRRNALETRNFVRRTRMFLVDHIADVQVSLSLGSKVVTLDPTGKDGHFFENVRMPASLVDDLVVGDGSRSPRVEIACADRPTAVAASWLLAESGISVISDIDDTIKRTDVRHTRELLRNTFLRDHVAIPGMADLYRRWSSEGVAFHYVSNAPWQLFDDLSGFLAREGFPEGEVHLRRFRWKDGSILEFFRSPTRHKEERIRVLIGVFPARRFVLVGDAGERDPEIYGALAREFPRSVARVLVREVAENPLGEARSAECFCGVDRGRWQTFRNPEEIDGVGAI